METRKITDKYNHLVAHIEEMPIYDGRGEYNGYTCEKCGKVTVTRYRDKGVTPFITRCRFCGGFATHKITSKNPPPEGSQKYSRVYEWVRPTLGQLLLMEQPVIHHVLNGGLVLDDEIKESEQQQEPTTEKPQEP